MTALINFRVTDAEMTTLKSMAKDAGMNVSSYCRQRCLTNTPDTSQTPVLQTENRSRALQGQEAVVHPLLPTPDLGRRCRNCRLTGLSGCPQCPKNLPPEPTTPQGDPNPS